MGERSVLAGFYADPKFIDAMNANYTVDGIKRSVLTLKSHAGFSLSTMKWGEYQPILTPRNKWPGKTYDLWQESMLAARDSLAEQENTQPLDSEMPPTKCALLDAAIRKCFNSQPPIPIVIAVTVKAASDPYPTRHDVKLEWNSVADQTTLNLTMVCPYEPPTA